MERAEGNWYQNNRWERDRSQTKARSLMNADRRAVKSQTEMKSSRDIPCIVRQKQ